MGIQKLFGLLERKIQQQEPWFSSLLATFFFFSLILHVFSLSIFIFSSTTIIPTTLNVHLTPPPLHFLKPYFLMLETSSIHTTHREYQHFENAVVITIFAFSQYVC